MWYTKRMSYNISTMYIWRYFNGECECPMCKIKQIVERDIADLYLSEAVMEDAERARVNKYGFCDKHYDLLYLGRSKLGLALQMSTRLNRLIDITKVVEDDKKAVKLTKKLKENTESCIICNKIEFHLERYFATVPALYRDDAKFREKNFKEVKGFCYPHFIRLVENSKKAGKYSKEFLNEIITKEQEYLTSLKQSIDEFTLAFDYRNTSLPSKESSASLKTARLRLYGDLSLPPERK